MKIVVKKLSSELENDYIEYFETKAFTDGSEFQGCYCMWYHWTDELDVERSRCPKDNQKFFKRELAKTYIKKGFLQGYLAYVNDEVVGWCNANDRINYERLSKKSRPDLWVDYSEKDKVKSIVCYVVAPDMRGKGIATELLKYVCKDAANEGYSYVEAYPAMGEFKQVNYHGPLSMYERQGFVLYKNVKEAIVRKYF